MQEMVKIICDVDEFSSRYNEITALKDNLIFTAEHRGDDDITIWANVKNGNIIEYKTILYNEKNNICKLSAKEFLIIILTQLHDSNIIDIKSIVDDNLKNNMVEISDYLKKLRDDHKLKIHLCPRQTGVTYDIITNKHALMVDGNKNKNNLKYKYPLECDQSVILIRSEIDKNKQLEELSGIEYCKATLSLDNCYLLYDTNGIRIDWKDVPKKLFNIFTPFSKSKLYVTQNMYDTLKLFDRLEFWYTIEKCN